MRRRRITGKQAPPEAYRAGAGAAHLPGHVDEGSAARLSPRPTSRCPAERIANYLEVFNFVLKTFWRRRPRRPWSR
eukprot:4340758-Alexandrium_andersonii.AAC.1